MAVKKFNSFEAIPADDETTYICALDEGMLCIIGDVTLMRDGGAVVMNEWNGLHFFDTYAEAFEYIEFRMCEEPVFVRK